MIFKTIFNLYNNGIKWHLIFITDSLPFENFILIAKLRVPGLSQIFMAEWKSAKFMRILLMKLLKNNDIAGIIIQADLKIFFKYLMILHLLMHFTPARNAATTMWLIAAANSFSFMPFSCYFHAIFMPAWKNLRHWRHCRHNKMLKKMKRNHNYLLRKFANFPPSACCPPSPT